MTRPLRIQYPGAYYHVTCRGNEKKVIFTDAQDQKAFLEKLSLSLEIYNVSLLAYVCMPNHFHLLATTPDGNLSEFMRHFNISYTSVFNHRHSRVGHLYQGRYKAFLIDSDNYLLKVSRYIHLNPIRIESYAEKSFDDRINILLKCKASSLLGYFSVGKRRGFVNYSTVLDYMGGDNRSGRQEYRKFIELGIDQDTENPLESGKGIGIVGEADFIQQVKERFLSKEVFEREKPALRELRKIFEPDELIDNFACLISKRRCDICQRGKRSVERSMLMEFLYRFCRITQPEIGKLLAGIDYSTVSNSRKRLQVMFGNDLQLKRRFDKLCDQLIQISRGKI